MIRRRTPPVPPTAAPGCSGNTGARALVFGCLAGLASFALVGCGKPPAGTSKPPASPPSHATRTDTGSAFLAAFDITVGEGGLPEALARLRGHNGTPDASQVAAATRHLARPIPDLSVAMPESELYNEAIRIALADQGKDPGVFDAFLAVCAVPGYSDLQRDYCIQNLPVLCATLESPGNRRMVSDILWKHARGGDPGLAATAILSLASFHEASPATGKAMVRLDLPKGTGPAPIPQPPFDRTELVDFIGATLGPDCAAAPAVRTACLHAAESIGMEAVLAPARSIAADTRQRLLLRRAAIHAIGRFGAKAEDTAFLTTTLAGDPGIDKAVRSAMAQLESR